MATSTSDCPYCRGIGGFCQIPSTGQGEEECSMCNGTGRTTPPDPIAALLADVKQIIEYKNENDGEGLTREERAYIDIITALDAALRAAQDRERELVEAWEALPGPARYPAKDVERWICGPMTKAVNNIRAALAHARRETDAKEGV